MRYYTFVVDVVIGKYTYHVPVKVFAADLGEARDLAKLEVYQTFKVETIKDIS